MRIIRIVLALAWLAPTVVRLSAESAQILSADELALLDQENALWRAVQPDLDVPANLQRLRQLGFDAASLEWFLPKLEAIWNLPGSGGLQILDIDTREKIKNIEHDLVGSYRNARRFEESGVRPATGPLYSRTQLNVMWRQALLRALSYGEMRDYRLARSAEAIQIGRLTEGMTVSPVEQRALIRMLRDYGYQTDPLAPPRTQSHQLETQLDYYATARRLLGDERFVRYLERDNPTFLTLRQGLGPETPPATLLNLFWLQQKTLAAVRNHPLSVKDRARLAEQTREEAALILDHAALQAYLTTEQSRWLYPR